MLNDVSKIGCGGDEGIGWGHGWIGEVLVFEEHSGGNASATGGG
jgi:hypothetical protein